MVLVAAGEMVESSTINETRPIDRSDSVVTENHRPHIRRVGYTDKNDIRLFGCGCGRIHPRRAGDSEPSALDFVRECTTSRCPPASKCPAIGSPMMPKPINATRKDMITARTNRK